MKPKRQARRHAPAEETSGGLPSREDLLKFISEADGKVGKREIARAFRITGGQRIPLKRMLREMTEEGLITKQGRKSVTPAGELPSVAVIEITGRDPDGEFIAKPVKWDDKSDPPSIVLAPNRGSGATNTPPAGVGDRVLARLTRLEGEDAADFAYEARVLKRLGKSAQTVLGVFRKDEKGGRVVPVDKKNRYEFTVSPENVGGAKPGDLVLAERLGGRAYGLHQARVREQLGTVGDDRSISLIAVHAHGLRTEFPADVMEEAESAKEATLGKRTDLRDIPLLTIDPPDARDHDDAVWAAPDTDPDNPGGHVVVVAIADVAAYVTPGSALDREAEQRGNSVYFPDRVVPMLPERISNDLCSLKEGVDRPCLAVRMVFDAEGRKKSHHFERALMRSAAGLSYAEMQAAIDGNPGEKAGPLMETALRPLWAAYEALKKAREKRSPLGLDMPEHKIEFDADGRMKGIRIAERYESMKLIEEFMIQANVAAAETLEKRRSPLIYRVHDQPSREKLKALSEFLKSLDLSFSKAQQVRSSHFNEILDRGRGNDYEQLLNDVVLRSQAQAVYTPENLGHFGLNLRRYAHFTSPIRRYADLIVHRALISGLKLGEDGLKPAEAADLDRIAEHISQTERRAMLAERDSVDRFVASYLQSRQGATFEGRISGVSRFGLFVRLKETGADGIVPISSLGSEYFHHVEERHALVGDETGRAYQLGEEVTVRLEEATPVTGGLRFSLIDGKATDSRRKPGGAPRSPGRRRPSKPAAKTGRPPARSRRRKS